MNYKDIAEMFSSGRFSEAEQYLADDVVWNMYEDKKILTGKQAVTEFTKKVSNFFQSVNPKFETYGILEDGDKVAIYGRAEFFRGSAKVNTVYSCDVYIFSPFGKIKKIHSYCNSSRPQINLGL